jgi:HlyD family secretion protein
MSTALERRRRHPAGQSSGGRRKTIVVLALAAAGLVVATLYGLGGRGEPRFYTAKVERGPLAATVSTTGTLSAVVTVQVGTEVSGLVRELLVDFNSQVKKGQLIARIDPQAFEARVSQARADLEGAEANVLNQTAQLERARAEVAGAEAQGVNQRSQVERASADVDNARAALAGARAQTAKSRVALLDAQRELQRKVDLYGKELVSRSERDSAQAAHDSAVAQLDSSEAQERALASGVRSALAQLESSKAQVDAVSSGIRSARAQLQVVEAQLQAARAAVNQRRGALQQAQVDLERTLIRSPVDGVVVARNVDVGQTVAASLQAPTLFTIAQDLSRMQVDTNVDEADIGRIQVGQRATFTVDAFRGQTFAGRVREIRKAAKVVQNVVTYNVVIAVDNPRQKLLPGMTATARIVLDSRSNALTVPNAALRFRPEPVDGVGASAEEVDSGRTAGAQKPAARTPGSGGGGRPGTVWVLREGMGLQRVVVRLGMTDGTSTEVLDGGLKEGDTVVVAAARASGAGSTSPAPGAAPRLRF